MLLSLGNPTDTEFASIGQRLVAETGIRRAVATQLDVASAIPSMVSAASLPMDWTNAIHANSLARFSPVGMTRSPLAHAAFEGSSLSILPHLEIPPAALGMAGLNVFLPRTVIDDLLPTFSLGLPFDGIMQQVTRILRSAYRFDTVRLFGANLFGQLDEVLFPPGTIHGDLYLLLRQTADPIQVEDAVHRVAEQIPWRIRNPQVWRAIVTRADEEQTSVSVVIHRELCAAILLVLETRDIPQTHRFGRDWLVGDDGRKMAFPPHDLPTRMFWRWLCNKVIAMAELAVLERPFPVTGDVLDRPKRTGLPVQVMSLDATQMRTHGGTELDLMLVDERDPLTMLIEQHEQDEDAARLLAVLEAASPRQRELLALIGAGLSEAAAARKLGMAPASARVQLHRLRQKAV